MTGRGSRSSSRARGEAALQRLRRKRLQRLRVRHHSVAALARDAGVSVQLLTGVLAGQMRLTDQMARQIEQRLALPAGWLDGVDSEDAVAARAMPERGDALVQLVRHWDDLPGEARLAIWLIAKNALGEALEAPLEEPASIRDTGSSHGADEGEHGLEPVERIVPPPLLPQECPAPQHPGQVLDWCLSALGLSSTRAGRDTGIAPPTIDGIRSGRTPIRYRQGLRLAAYLGLPADYWMALQLEYDLWRALDYVPPERRAEIRGHGEERIRSTHETLGDRFVDPVAMLRDALEDQLFRAGEADSPFHRRRGKERPDDEGGGRDGDDEP